MLQSIADQTFRDFELIVIDGDSTDGTQEILRGYDELLSYWISEPDGSIAEAWNKALAWATGDWVLFLGVDDALHNNRVLEEMAPSLRNETADIVYGQVQIEHGLFDGQILGGPFDIERLRRSMTVPHIGTFHARRLFDEVGLYDPDFRIALDYELLLRKRDLGARFVPILVALMNGAGGTSTNNLVMTFRDAARAQRKHRVLSPPAIFLRFLREVAYYYFVRLKARYG